jgi:hypothetical protein
MQTFITSKYSSEIAQNLDNKRLHKQALEAWQILMVLCELDPQGNERKPKGWVNHPAVKMWRGHEYYLYYYACQMVEEWEKRGYKSTLKSKLWNTVMAADRKGVLSIGKGINEPSWWLNDETIKKVISTHRRALLVKDYEWYHRFEWEEDTEFYPESYEYFWPVTS